MFDVVVEETLSDCSKLYQLTAGIHVNHYHITLDDAVVHALAVIFIPKML